MVVRRTRTGVWRATKPSNVPTSFVLRPGSQSQDHPRSYIFLLIPGRGPRKGPYDGQDVNLCSTSLHRSGTYGPTLPFRKASSFLWCVLNLSPPSGDLSSRVCRRVVDVRKWVRTGPCLEELEVIGWRKGRGRESRRQTRSLPVEKGSRGWREVTTLSSRRFTPRPFDVPSLRTSSLLFRGLCSQ